MNQAILGLTLTYVALAALLLGIFLLTRLPAWIKLLCVILTSSFYYITYVSLQGVLGWPTKQELPEHFQLLAASITEPDENTGERGSIHLWLSTFVDNKPTKEPRAYELSYNLDLHISLNEALMKQQRGHVQIGKRLEQLDDENLPKEKKHLSEVQQRFEFFDLPDPELPEK